MLQFGARARPSLRPLFVCTSCRSHLVSRPIQHSAPALAPPAAAAAAAPQPDSSSPSPSTEPATASKKGRSKRSRGKKPNKEDTRLKLWGDTLTLLKDLQSSPALFPSASGEPAPQVAKGKTQEEAKKKKGKGSKSPKGSEHAAPNQAPQVPARELELIQSAFKVLEKVLGKEARQEAREEAVAAAEKPAKASKKSKSAKAATPTKREKRAEAMLNLVKKGKFGKEPPKKPEKEVDDKKPSDALSSARRVVARKGTPEKTTGGDGPKSRRQKKAKGNFTIQSVNPATLVPIPVEKAQPPVPKLTYGLDRVLFNPGVYHLQDPRSRVFNFDPYLARIMPIKEFDFNALKAYITSSKDTTLISMAAEHNKKYTGSTSSMTSMLAHFHYLLSSWRPINPAVISRDFRPDSENFTKILRAPAATFLHYKNGTYAIDADKQFDTANVLSMLGKSMEKLLTLPKEDFEKYRRTKSQELTDEDRNGPEAYHYTTMGDFMMRSQLDAYDPRIPGTGMFDLKTRAVVSIRMDAKGFHKGLGYEIRGRFGQWESFEREYYDMIRAAFIKYSLQVRMGRMDGIFVAYHNTERIFGFQYIPLTEMDLALHGTSNLTLGHREYKASIHILNEILDKATERFPKQTLRIHVETRPTDPPLMYVFAKPVTPGEVEAIQGANRAKVEEFERNMMGLGEDDVAQESAASVDEAFEEHDVEEAEEAVEDPEDEETKLDVWEDMMDKVEETIENDEQGMTSVRAALEQALRESGLLRNSTPEDQTRYLEMLVEALISGVEPMELPSDEGVSETHAEDAVEESQDGTTEDATVEDSKAVPDVVEEAVVEDSTSTSVEHADQTEADAQPAEEPSDEPTLGELILRLAARLQTEPSRPDSAAADADVQSEEEVSSDALRLRKFESILSELVTKTQEDTDDPTPSEPAAAPAPPTPTTASETTTQDQPAPPPPDALYGMILTVNNRVNGQYVARPERLGPGDKWIIEYAVEEMDAARAARIYAQCMKRREAALHLSDDRDSQWRAMFRGDLERYSEKGRQHRRRENEASRRHPVHVLGCAEGPLEYASVFGPEAGGVGDYRPWKGEGGADWETGEGRKRWVRRLDMDEFEGGVEEVEVEREGEVVREDEGKK